MDKAYVFKDTITNIHHLEVKEIHAKIVSVRSNNQSDLSMSLVSHNNLSVSQIHEDRLTPKIPKPSPSTTADISKDVGQVVV